MENTQIDANELIKQMSSDYAIDLANKQHDISILKVQIKELQDKLADKDKKE